MLEVLFVVMEMPIQETLPCSVAQSLGPRVNHLGSNPSVATYWVGDLEELLNLSLLQFPHL